MKREIKFRGKQIDSGEWLVGDLVQDNSWGDNIRRCHIYPEGAWDSPDHYEVDPDTVGQYTGLKDKGGQEIYEGDIVRIDWLNGLYSVVYDYASFLISAPHTIRHDLSQVVKGSEVVGNIHDNPELLKGGAK